MRGTGSTPVSDELEVMKRLQQLARRLVVEGQFEPVLQEVLDAAIAIAGADCGTVQLFDPSEETLQIACQRGFPDDWVTNWDHVEKRGGACMTALAARQRVIVEDIERTEIFNGAELALLRGQGIRALQSIPLVSRTGHSLGMFSTCHHTPRHFDPDNLSMLELFAQEAATIIDHARADETLKGQRHLIETLVEEMPAAVALIRGTDLRVIFVSRAYQAIASDRKMLGRTLDQIWPEGKWNFQRICRSALDSGEIYRAIDQPFMTRNLPDRPAEEVYFTWSLRRIRLPDSGEWGLLVAAQDTTERKRAELDLRTRKEQLARLLSDLQLAEQRERRRLAAVLHDDFQQLLVAARLRLDMLESSPADDFNRAKESILELINEAIDRSRSLTSELSPPILQVGGLDVALQWLSDWMLRKYGLTVELENDAGAELEPGRLSRLLFEAVRELLFNTVKHAGVTFARVSFSIDEAQVRITVSDDGAGFEPKAVLERGIPSDQFGLLNVRERIELIGGSVEIDSKPGDGTRIAMQVPRHEEFDIAG